MLQFEELRLELNDNKQKLSELREALGLDALKEEIAKLEEQTAAEEFWGDIENSQKVLQRISQLKNKVAAYTSLETAFDDTMTLIELADEERISPCSTSAARALQNLRTSSRSRPSARF